MKQLSPVDTSFLSMETSTQFGHVSSIIILEPSGPPQEVYAHVRQAFEERIHLLDVYRRKLVSDPFHLDNPYWVDDPDLDLEFHIREIAIPLPGTDAQFGEQIARIVSRPLDRSRPLWEWYVITGLEGGLVGILTKVHHSTIDGASGVGLLQVLLDTDPEGRPAETDIAPWKPERMPSPVELVGRALLEYGTKPKKAIALQLEMIRVAGRLSGNPAFWRMMAGANPALRWMRHLSTDKRDGVELPRLPTRSAPRTPFNHPITAHRRFAFRTLQLTDAQTVKRAFDVTVNDVVMAICSSALRRYLLDHDALPEDSLVAMVPVSVRSGNEADTYTNRVTGITCPLHTEIADPVERLLAIHEEMAAAKELQRAIPATILTDITQFTPPGLAAQASRMASRVRITDRMRPPFNVTISNVPGPREPLYLHGSPMRHFIPVSIVAEGQGLNMTVQSYLDNLDFGLIACRELVPDLWDLCNHLDDAMAELVKAAGE
jgi:WS/DGAT/MGAT family acyltransferase